MDGGIPVRRNDNYMVNFISAAVLTFAYVIWFLEDHRFWKNPWVMVAFFAASVLLELTIGFVKWRRFKKENS